jgi:hypothetical protein
MAAPGQTEPPSLVAVMVELAQKAALPAGQAGESSGRKPDMAFSIGGTEIGIALGNAQKLGLHNLTSG